MRVQTERPQGAMCAADRTLAQNATFAKHFYFVSETIIVWCDPSIDDGVLKQLSRRLVASADVLRDEPERQIKRAPPDQSAGRLFEMAHP